MEGCSRGVSTLAGAPPEQQLSVNSHPPQRPKLLCLRTHGPCNPAVKQRMKSVGNIQKITKAMKMVAASKMRSATAATENSRGIVQPFLRMLGDMPDTQGAKAVFVPVTSDKGLCGGINSTVCKCVRLTAVLASEEGGAGGGPRFGTSMEVGEAAGAGLGRSLREAGKRELATRSVVALGCRHKLPPCRHFVGRLNFDLSGTLFSPRCHSLRPAPCALHPSPLPQVHSRHRQGGARRRCRG